MPSMKRSIAPAAMAASLALVAGAPVEASSQVAGATSLPATTAPSGAPSGGTSGASSGTGPVSGPNPASRIGRAPLRRGPGRSPTASPPDGPDLPIEPGRKHAQVECSIAIDPNDEQHLVGVSIDLSSGISRCRWCTSFDGGATFTTGEFQVIAGYFYSGDPTVVITPTGVAVVHLLQYLGPGGEAIYSYRSLDGGLAWEAPVRVDLARGNDKVQSAVDLSGGPHHGQIAIAWSRYASVTGESTYAAVSDDDGASYRDVQRIDDGSLMGSIGADVAYGPGSELWVMWADRWNEEIRLDVSRDGGATFGADLVAGSYKAVPSPLPGQSFRLFDVFSLAIDATSGPWRGSLYVAYHRYGGSPVRTADVYLLRSHDGGATWAKTNVNVADTAAADQVMPWIDVDPHGNVDILFWDTRLDPANHLLSTWVARSSDGGQSFVEHPVGDVSFDFDATDGAFLGDYLGLASGPTRGHAFFPDGSSGSLDVTHDALRLQLHTDVDTVSAATGGAVVFTLAAGPNFAGASYWLLGSFSATQGLDLGPVHLPIDYDPLFQMTIDLANTPFLQPSPGVLDSRGGATIRLDSCGPFDPALAGLTSHWSAYLHGPRPLHATAATTVAIVP
jgi:hypothetical protein